MLYNISNSKEVSPPPNGSAPNGKAMDAKGIPGARNTSNTNISQSNNNVNDSEKSNLTAIQATDENNEVNPKYSISKDTRKVTNTSEDVVAEKPDERDVRIKQLEKELERAKTQLTVTDAVKLRQHMDNR